MRRTILSTIGLLFIALFVSACFFLAGPEGEVQVLQQSPLPTATTPSGPTPLPTPEFCISATHDCVLLEFMGYVQNGDGTTTLNYRITNNCADEVEYFAIETGFWSRDTPADGSSYSGDLGTHAVSWVDEQQGIPTQGLRFDSQTTGFKEGASERYTFTVRDFTPRSPNTGRVVVGERELAFRMMLLDPACEIGINPTPRPTPTAPFSPLPTPTPIPIGYTLPTEPVVPECVFAPPAGGLPPDEPVIPLSAYSFSEPQVVLTNTALLEVHQWLPDNKTLLMNQYTDKGNPIILLDTQSDQVTYITDLDQQVKSPIWLSKDSTVIWRDLGSTNHERGFWLRSFELPGERQLEGNGNGAGLPRDISPDGNEFVFMSLPGGTQPFIWNQETKVLSALPFDLATWRYQNGPTYPLRPFNINWHPSGNKILFWDNTWVFLYELTSRLGCEIKQGERLYIREASWSPNGRYLVGHVGEHISSLHPPYGIVQVLDTYTGKSVYYSSQIPIGDFAWAPDNQTVAMSGPTGEKSGDFDQHGIYLLNIHIGGFQRILAGENLSYSNPKWTSDGAQLAFYCNDYSRGFNFDNYRVCVSQVTVNR